MNVSINALLLAALCLIACNTTSKSAADTTYYKSPSAQSFDPASAADLLGTWDITIETRRGSKSSALTIYEENNQLKGKSDKSNFVIQQNGNRLSWTSKIDSPMGSLNAQHDVTVDGNTMKGTIKASGRTINLSGKKR